MHLRRISACAMLAIASSTSLAFARESPPATDLKLVVIVTRHGVRSPTDPNELSAYAAKPWPTWNVAPGDLTENGAKMMTHFGASYRAYYAAQGVLPAAGCPATDRVYVRADVDERTKATAVALLDGLAPRCGFAASSNAAENDPVFHAIPSLGTADAASSTAALGGAIGYAPAALVAANGLSFARLDAILGCAASACRLVSKIPTTIVTSPKTGLASVTGAIDLASTAVEDFILAYADGKPMADVGFGAVDRQTLLELSQLHSLKFAVNTEPFYNASVQGSNLLSHVVATIDQGATGTKSAKTDAPTSAAFVAYVGHDTNLEELAGMLHLHWLVPGYQVNDTPPGGALVFELHEPDGSGPAFVRMFFTAQSLDQMRSLSSDAPARVAVLLPGCPALDCPIATFDRITSAAIDPAFVR